MTLPGIPALPLPEGDDEFAARRLLALVDANQDRAVMFKVDYITDEQLEADEARMIRFYEIAKLERPDLAVMLLPAAYVGENTARGLAIVVHEHRWVGGLCVNGCRDTREAA